MHITAIGLTKAAAVAAVTAGAIFVAVQLGHPASDTFTTETSQWVARSLAKTVMFALALAGDRRPVPAPAAGRPACSGCSATSSSRVGYLALLSTEVIAAAVLPSLVDTEPAFVDDVVVAANGGVALGDIGEVAVLLGVAGAGYILGGLSSACHGPCGHRQPLGCRPSGLQHGR